jgi:hypothetical protein
MHWQVKVNIDADFERMWQRDSREMLSFNKPLQGFDEAKFIQCLERNVAKTGHCLNIREMDKDLEEDEDESEEDPDDSRVNKWLGWPYSPGSALASVPR